MRKGEVNENRDAVSDGKWSVGICVFMVTGFAFMISSIIMDSNMSNTSLFAKLPYIAPLLLLCWGGVLLTNANKSKHVFQLLGGVSGLVMSIECFVMYYLILYKQLNVQSPFFMIVAICGWLMFFIWIVIIKLRAKENETEAKNVRTSILPLGPIVAIGSIVANSFIRKLSTDNEAIIIAMGTLFISYVFSMSVIFVIDYIYHKKELNNVKS